MVIANISLKKVLLMFDLKENGKRNLRLASLYYSLLNKDVLLHRKIIMLLETGSIRQSALL